MRPINVTISAFGPYKDQVYIDFTQFDNGIFLITGDTGSGKTTIFDAICFALFGIASGSNRGKSSFRSDFADDDVKTFVILEFIHKNISYKVTRSLGYMRKKKRGEGYTQVSGDASCEYLDNVITGDKYVTEKCEEILGINSSQFKQISMIAQGEFLKLLLAKPGDRAEIFRKIFDTYIYRDISDSLKRKYLDVKSEYEKVGMVIDNLKESFIVDDDVMLNDRDIKEFFDIISKVICKDKEKEDKLDEEKTNILNKIQNITNDISNANLINDSFDKYETIDKSLKILMNEKDNIDNKRLIVSKNKEIMDKVMPCYNEVLRLDNLIKDKDSDLVDNKKLYSEVGLEYTNILDEYNNLNLSRKKIDVLKLDLSKLENMLPLFLELDSLNKELMEKRNIYNLLELNSLNDLLKLVDDNKKLNNDYLEKKASLLKIKDKYNKLASDYNLMYNKFIDSQAGIIASDLKDNCPCPVCGSLDHPNPASLDGDYISKYDLDLIKEKLDNCQVELDKSSEEVNSLGQKLEISNNEVKDIDVNDLYSKLDNYSNVKDKGIDVSEYNISDIVKEISYIEASIDSKSSLINDEDTEELVNEKISKVSLEIERVNKYINDVTSKYEELLSKKTSLESVIDVINKELDKLNSDRKIASLKYSSSYKSLGYVLEKDYLSVKLDDEVCASYELEVSNYDKQVNDLNSRLNTLSEVIKDKERIDVSSLKEKKCQMDNELSEIELSLKSVHSKYSNNKIVYDKLESVYKKYEKIEDELAIYEDLSNTANGNIKGKNKLEFEQYVQASYFDNVLVSANKRFSYMTDSRYLLSRKIEATKVSDKLGLELEVIDNYTGKRREITSLSGGESFKASLSLALGMSDVIQSYSGGVVVDTMFIDEGFGSLDNDSLESAMNAILMLSDSDKLIGIISHVDELKDRIDKKIVVKKTNCGSSVSVVV